MAPSRRQGKANVPSRVRSLQAALRDPHALSKRSVAALGHAKVRAFVSRATIAGRVALPLMSHSSPQARLASRTLKFLRASPQTKRLLAESALTLVAVRCLLHVLPFPQIRERYLSTTCGESPGETTADPGSVDRSKDVQQLVWAVEVVSRGLPLRLACLPRAIALCKMLETRGYPATLRIGVGRGTDGAFLAHAWVVYRGVVVLGGLPNLDSFVPLSNWPQQAK